MLPRYQTLFWVPWVCSSFNFHNSVCRTTIKVCFFFFFHVGKNLRHRQINYSKLYRSHLKRLNFNSDNWAPGHTSIRVLHITLQVKLSSPTYHLREHARKRATLTFTHLFAEPISIEYVHCAKYHYEHWG